MDSAQPATQQLAGLERPGRMAPSQEWLACARTCFVSLHRSELSDLWLGEASSSSLPEASSGSLGRSWWSLSFQICRMGGRRAHGN